MEPEDTQPKTEVVIPPGPGLADIVGDPEPDTTPSDVAQDTAAPETGDAPADEPAETEPTTGDSPAETTEQRIERLEASLLATGQYERDDAGTLVLKADAPATAPATDVEPIVTVTADELDQHPSVIAWWRKDPDPDASSETAMVDDPYWAQEATKQHRAALGDPTAELDVSKLSYDGWLRVKENARAARLAEQRAEVEAVNAVNTHFGKELTEKPAFKAVPAAIESARGIVRTLRGQGVPAAAINGLMPIIEALAFYEHAETLLNAPAVGNPQARERSIQRAATPGRIGSGAKPVGVEAVRAKFTDPNFQFSNY